MGCIHRNSFAGIDSQHTRLLVLTLAMFCLSFAVFNWGLQYKMSLYQHSDEAAKTSVAKLWTGNKDHNQADNSALPQFDRLPILIPLLILALTTTVSNQPQLTAFQRRQRMEPVWKHKTAPTQNAYFFRPPPSNS